MITVHTSGSENLQFSKKEKKDFFYFFYFRKHKRDIKQQNEIAKLECTCVVDVTHNEETTSKKVLNENVVQELNDIKNEIEKKNALLVEHQNATNELKEEKAIIEEIGSKLAHYNNSNSTFVSLFCLILSY